MADTRKPRKEYRAGILVRLTDDLLPQTAVSKAEVEAHLAEALSVGDPTRRSSR